MYQDRVCSNMSRMSMCVTKGYVDYNGYSFKLGLSLYPITPGLFEGGSAWGGGRKVPEAHNSKTVNGNGIKFGGVVENHKLINLV